MFVAVKSSDIMVLHKALYKSQDSVHSPVKPMCGVDVVLAMDSPL